MCRARTRANESTKGAHLCQLHVPRAFHQADSLVLAALFSDESAECDDTHRSSDTFAGAAFALGSRVKQGSARRASSSRPMRIPSVFPEEARGLVGQLSPIHPKQNFVDVEEQVATGVSMRTGGPDCRSRLEILRDMRAAVGLPPFVVPVGLPVGSAPDKTEHASRRAKLSFNRPSFHQFRPRRHRLCPLGAPFSPPGGKLLGIEMIIEDKSKSMLP